ncbi:MAG: hypothetical protein JXR97_04030 [Planctomycetes bacterium]|nr:hypothetical protein [Planctomycetota bacterium]
MADGIDSIEQELNSFDAKKRAEGLGKLAGLIEKGEITVKPLTGWINTHLHTFHSFNAEDFSPSGIVWEGKKQGLDVVGSVDFDVLDAMEELFRAGDALNVRAVAALESRVFVADYADKVLNSPGEPGVNYYMGTGFTRMPDESSEAFKTIKAMRNQARARNEAMLARIMPALAPLELDYEKDVIPLTPGGNATERHLLAALDQKARAIFGNAKELAGFWSEKLGIAVIEADKLVGDAAALRNTIRSKLMKKGGVGYVQPDDSTFPPLADVTRMILDCKAIPCMAWLDGTTDGEADVEAWLDYFLAHGCLALNIIPDRNWNISDPAAKSKKVAKFAEIVEGARRRDLIFSIGTEMNNYGLKFVDTFDAPEMASYAEDFKNGAYILYGHTVMERALGMGRTSEWAKEQFGDDRKKANEFYLMIGTKAYPVKDAIHKLSGLGSSSPQEIIGAL